MTRTMVAFLVVFSTHAANADGLVDYIADQPVGVRKALAFGAILLVLFAIKWFWQTMIGKTKEDK